jgi:hypothetical protein
MELCFFDQGMSEQICNQAITTVGRLMAVIDETW